MTHEPECSISICITSGWAFPPTTCDCDRIRAAYERGREDGAKMKGWLCFSCYTHWSPTVDKCLLCEEGEQE